MRAGAFASRVAFATSPSIRGMRRGVSRANHLPSSPFLHETRPIPVSFTLYFYLLTLYVPSLCPSKPALTLQTPRKPNATLGFLEATLHIYKRVHKDRKIVLNGSVLIHNNIFGGWNDRIHFFFGRRSVERKACTVLSRSSRPECRLLATTSPPKCQTKKA